MVVLPPETVRFLKDTGFSLKRGSLARMKVVKPLAGGSWQVSIGGKLFAVRSTVPLKTGQILTARVFIKGNTVNLKILSGKTGQRPVPPVHTEAAVLNLVLQRSNLPVTEGVLAALKRSAAGGSFEEKLFRMRLAAILLEKGIDPGEDVLERLLKPIAGTGGERESEEGGGRRGRGHGGAEGDRPGEDSKEKEDTASEFLKEVRDQTGRTADPPNHPLQLFNHLQGPEGTWIIIPLALHRKGTEITGSLRLLMDKLNRGNWSRGALVVTSGENTWCFTLFKRSGSPEIGIIYPEEVTPERIEKSLSQFLEKCEKVGVKIDDKVYRGAVFDGFTSEQPRKNIDTLV